MKLVKGKYIRLTEQELTKLISEEVNKRLQLIMEYAIPRAKYIDNVSNLTYQIIENWCLVHYCTLVGQTELKDHWKSELYAHIDNLGKDTIKGSKNVETKFKATIEGFQEKDAFDGPERILKIIQHKFSSEGINLKSDAVMQVVEDFSNEVENIVHIIADYFNVDVNKYLNEI